MSQLSSKLDPRDNMDFGRDAKRKERHQSDQSDHWQRFVSSTGVPKPDILRPKIVNEIKTDQTKLVYSAWWKNMALSSKSLVAHWPNMWWTVSQGAVNQSAFKVKNRQHEKKEKRSPFYESAPSARVITVMNTTEIIFIRVVNSRMRYFVHLRKNFYYLKFN